MSTTLKKITAEAKRIVKRAPKTKWVNAVKQAGAKYRAGKLGAVKKRAAKKVSGVNKKARIKAGTNRQGYIGPAVPVVNSTAKLRSTIADMVASAEKKKLLATSVKDKRDLQKRITQLKAMFNKLK